MNKYLKYILFLFSGIVIFLVYRSWFSFDLITSGDTPTFSKLQYEVRVPLLYAWNMTEGAGLGSFAGSLLWIHLNFGLATTIFGTILGFKWPIIERVYYLFPFLILSFIAPYYLFSKLINKNFSIFSSMIYMFNTYILMIAGGGQAAGVGMAYAILPFVLYIFIKTIEQIKQNNLNKAFRLSIISSLALSIQMLIDIRIAYVTLFAIFIFWIISAINNRNLKYFSQSVTFIFFIPGVLFLLTHAFWILPTIINRQNPIEEFGSAYSSLDAVKFFSFAKFENAISLLHPNWPENIFGKVGFMKPEFLLLPILAFTSLLFVNKVKTQKLKLYILYFSLLGLIGAFLAKGANEPLGPAYLWLFDHFPGFMMFRDPTKWYMLVSISYSVLIPFSIYQIYEWLKEHDKFSIFSLHITNKFKLFNFQNLFVFLFLSFLLFLIRPVFLGQLSGTFKNATVPNDYLKLEKHLESGSQFYRTLWFPTLQRFGFYSSSHPAVLAQALFKTVNSTEMISYLKTTEAKKLLQDAGVKYVIVPYDSQGEIFLKDRKYSEEMYRKTVDEVNSIGYLRKREGFGKIAVFEAIDFKDHFYIKKKDEKSKSKSDLKYKFISPVRYEIKIANSTKGDIVIFSESFDKNWIATVTDSKTNIKSMRYEKKFNSFVLPQSGTYKLIVYYTLQDYVNLGLIISGLTLVSILGYLIYPVLKR